MAEIHLPEPSGPPRSAAKAVALLAAVSGMPAMAGRGCREEVPV